MQHGHFEHGQRCAGSSKIKRKSEANCVIAGNGTSGAWAGKLEETMRAVGWCSAVALCLSTSATAIAQTSLPAPLSEAESKPPDARSRWYGWQILGTDAAAVLLLMAAGAGNEKANHTEWLAIPAAGSYVFGGPIVHSAHGNPGRAGISLGMRVGLPLLGILVGGLGDTCSSAEDNCIRASAALGGLLGLVTAVTVDTVVLPWEKPAPTAVPPAATPCVAVAPVIAQRGGGLTVGGAF